MLTEFYFTKTEKAGTEGSKSDNSLANTRLTYPWTNFSETPSA